MPAYEYQCQACGDRFERRQKMSDAAIDTCPQCGGAAQRLISGGAGVIARSGGSSSARNCAAADSCPMPAAGCCGGMCGSHN